MRIAFLATALILWAAAALAMGAPDYLPDGSHPRIWLTGANLSKLTAQRDANSADYQALISWCDAHLNDAGYDTGDVSWDGNNTFNGYRMGGYNKYLMNFAMAYQMLKATDPTKAAGYATYVRNILVNGIAVSLRSGEENNGLTAIRCGETSDRTINTTEATALGITTGSYKLGYSVRNIAAVPIAYDWIYDTLSTPDKQVLSAMMLRWYDWIRGVRSTYNNGVLKSGVRYYEDTGGSCTGSDSCTGYTGTAQLGYSYGTIAANFMGGFAYYMALAPVAVYGDNTDVPSYVSAFKTMLSSTIIDQLESNVKHSGGDSVEGWNYGGGYVYTLPGLYGYYTATADPAIPAMTWPTALVDAMAHRLEGNLLNVPIYGEWTGTPLGTNRKFSALPFISIAQKLAPSSDLSGVGRYLLDNVTYSDSVDPWYQFIWYDGSVTPKAPSVLPLSHVATGNGFATSRSSWTNAADSTHLSVRLEGKSSSSVSHEVYDEGHLSLSRGGDRLLVHANMQSASNMHNSIVFNNQSHHSNNPTLTAPVIRRKADTGSYFYVSGDITNSWKRQFNTDRASLFVRSLFHLRPGIVVVSDTTRSNTAVGNWKDWYTQYGADPVLDASNLTVSATVGSSKVYTKTLYPLGGTLTKDAPFANFYRVKYTPAVAQEYTQFLHVVEATGPGATQTAIAPITGTGGRGALISDPTENKVVMFTSDQSGADITSLSYSVDTSAASRHYIADLSPNTTYSVSIDGGAAAIYTASSAGVIEFVNPVHSPHTYTVTQTGTPPVNPPIGTTTRVFNGRLSGSWH